MKIRGFPTFPLPERPVEGDGTPEFTGGLGGGGGSWIASSFALVYCFLAINPTMHKLAANKILHR